MADLRPLREIGGEGSLSLSSEQLALAEACRLRPRCNYKTLSRYSLGTFFLLKKGFIGNKCTLKLIYLKWYMVHAMSSYFMTCTAWSISSCVLYRNSLSAKDSAYIYYKLYLPQWHRQKLHITVIIFFLSSFFLSLIINLEYFVLRPDLTIDLHACWFFCSLKKECYKKVNKLNTKIF